MSTKTSLVLHRSHIPQSDGMVTRASGQIEPVKIHAVNALSLVRLRHIRRSIKNFGLIASASPVAFEKITVNVEVMPVHVHPDRSIAVWGKHCCSVEGLSNLYPGDFCEY